MTGPMPQPGAVNVICTATFAPCARLFDLKIIDQSEIDDIDREFPDRSRS